jgi:hypothetical protein
MWPTRQTRIAQIESQLATFSQKEVPLKGVADRIARHTLAMQIVASLRRIEYTGILKQRDHNARRLDPTSEAFDPERAAILHARSGNLDEAIWLVFLATHFGQHAAHGWRMLRDVYSGLGQESWTWQRISSSDPQEFRDWLRSNSSAIGGAFGNHRKYESLKDSPKGTAVVITDFVRLMNGSPSAWFASLVRDAGNDPTTIFDVAYHRFRVNRFGRLGKFDFLALLGRLDLAPISPGQAYLRNATGPLRGARLLLDDNPSSASSVEDLQAVLSRLDRTLGVGMQVMEDALCNWQKSPREFVHFRG